MEKYSGIKDVKEFYNTLEKAINASDKVVLNLTNIKRLHLSILTILSSAQKKVKNE